MSREEKAVIATYVSSLTVNLGNNKKQSKSYSQLERAQDSKSTRTSIHSVQSKDVISTHHQNIGKNSGTFYRLVTKPAAPGRPETRTSDTDSNTAFYQGKTYFEELNNGGENSPPPSSQDVWLREKEEQSHSTVLESSETFSASSATRRSYQESESPVTIPAALTSGPGSPVIQSFSEPSKSYDAKSLKTSSLSEVKNSTTSTVSHTKTTTTQETKTTETRAAKPASDYGETDWYMDILLRMQALEMKHQSLHVQYDFLGKLADDTREGLGQARDWERYESSEVEVY